MFCCDQPVGTLTVPEAVRAAAVDANASAAISDSTNVSTIRRIVDQAGLRFSMPERYGR